MMNQHEWRLGKDTADDLCSIKHNFNLDYIKKILLKHSKKLNLNVDNIDLLAEYYFKKGKPTEKKRTSYNGFFEFINAHTKEKYWLQRGWNKEQTKEKVKLQKELQGSYKKRLMYYYDYTEEEATNIYNQSLQQGIKTLKERDDYEELKDKKTISFKCDWYLTQINPKTNKKYTEEEAKKEYSKKQSKCGKLSASTKNKDQINTRIEYYLTRGLSRKDAEEALIERQTTNGLKYYINKYGLKKGKDKFEARMKKYGAKISDLRNKYPERWATAGKRYSESSKRFFDKLIEEIPELNNMTVRYATNEHFLWDKENKKIYFYDFYIKELNIIIEYHGVVWHPKERIQENWEHPYTKESSEKFYDKDQFKKELAKQNGIFLIEIWEDELTEKRKDIINELYKRINKKNNNK